jgi:hypothetical protein
VTDRDLVDSDPATTTVRVAFTGHRRNKMNVVLLDQLSTIIESVLVSIRAASMFPIEFITSLADGSDLTDALAALNLGVPLTCVVPFGIDEFRRDLHVAPDVATYDHVLASTSPPIVIEGSRESAVSRDDAYHRLGMYLIHTADILVAVWDGQNSAGPGGAAEIVSLAGERQIPVLWIQSAAPGDVSLIDHTGQIYSGAIDQLAHLAIVAQSKSQSVLPSSFT